MKNSYFKIIFFLILYYILLFWVYKNSITTRWDYTGFVNDFTENNFFYSIIGLITSIISFIIINKMNTPSSIVMNLFNLLFFIPLYVFIAFTETLDGFISYVLLYQITFLIFYKKIPFKFRPILYRNKIYFKFILGFVLIMTLFINGFYNGFKIKFDLSDVYENRLALRDLTMPSILNYIKAASYFVGIIALMYALKKKNIFLVISIVLIQLMSFAFGASKTQFFTLFICFIAYYFYSDKFKLWALVSLNILLILSILEIKYLNSTSITDFWTRRSLFVPGKISYNMFEFLNNPKNEYLYLRGSVLKIIGLEDPYIEHGGFQRLIGSKYGGTEDTNANTGLLGNDYAQFGWGAIIIYTYIRVYLLRLYDYCAKGIDNRIIVVLSIFIAFTYISGAFFSVLLTNGIILVNYLLYTFPRDTKVI